MRRFLCWLGLHDWKPRDFFDVGFGVMSRAECFYCRRSSLWHNGERVA